MRDFSAFRQPTTMGIATALFFSGITFAATLPYGAIVGIETLHIPKETYALLLTVSALAGAFASVVLGYISDRISDRRVLVLGCALMGALGYGLIYFSHTQWAFFLAHGVIMPFGFALFSQTFSFARTFYNLRHPDQAEFMVSVLRSIFAISWVIIPPIAGWVAAQGQVFDVYGIAALGYLGAALIFVLMMRDDRTKVGFDSKPVDGGSVEAPARGIALPIVFGLLGITLIKTALGLHIITMPLVIISELDGDLTDVGIFASLAALIEIPCMLAWAFALNRYSNHAIIAFNALLYALYLLLLSQAESVSTVLWLQGLNGVSSAALLSITISYMQDAIRGRVGLSTSLMDVVRVISVSVGAGIFGLVSIRYGYLEVFVVAGALAALGGVVLWLAHAGKWAH
ncbi:MAG: hypothetical protein COA52_19455 [Hyphomicrobiales bacterium]|nr:MAG: hypothetical protein COA52_19455 [Hyphomicrobiales bacterium]